ncbi:MAG: hypothetical protein KBD31_01020 [Proteobacteria bacterium]|nr:hypothetical protein [Pseudomonadota bacterium]
MFQNIFNSYKQSKRIGATFLVAGTTVGAGMLAMPLTAAGIGFMTSLVLLCVMWGLMYLAALIQVDLFKDQPNGISLATLVENILGKKYKIIPAVIKSLLFFSLLAAYISASASVMVQIFHLPITVSAILFTVTLGILISLDLKKMEQFNRIIVMFKFLFFILIAIILLPNVNFSSLFSENQPTNYSFLIISIPVFFTAFGFHGSIPSLSSFLKQDQKTLRKVFFEGTLIPLVTYILWMAITYSGAKICQLTNISSQTDLGQFLTHIGECSPNPFWVGLSLQWFSFFAFITSFIGVGLGQIDFIEEVLANNSKTSSKTHLRFLASLITVTIPLLFAIFYPNGFMIALAFAGGWLCILALFLPCLMAFVKKNTPKYIKIMASICLTFGIALFVILILKTMS